jgi:hypothetical protein
MGTRSLTRVFDGDEQVVTMYRQMDGYPGGHGKDLINLLGKLTETNGISDMQSPTFNGMGCLAAQIVKHFKDGVGGIYLVSPKGTHGAEYQYRVRSGGVGKPPLVEIYEGYDKRWKAIFNGTPAEFVDWFATKEAE